MLPPPASGPLDGRLELVQPHHVGRERELNACDSVVDRLRARGGRKPAVRRLPVRERQLAVWARASAERADGGEGVVPPDGVCGDLMKYDLAGDGAVDLGARVALVALVALVLIWVRVQGVEAVGEAESIAYCGRVLFEERLEAVLALPAVMSEVHARGDAGFALVKLGYRACGG